MKKPGPPVDRSNLHPPYPHGLPVSKTTRVARGAVKAPSRPGGRSPLASWAGEWRKFQ